MKEILFFDLDGTLTDSMLGITRAVQYALKHYGITVDDLKELQPFVGPPLHESFQEYFHFSEKDSHEAVFVFREYYNAKGWMENRPLFLTAKRLLPHCWASWERLSWA